LYFLFPLLVVHADSRDSCAPQVYLIRVPQQYKVHKHIKFVAPKFSKIFLE